MSELLRELKIAAVPHGFRSNFRDCAAEETDHPRSDLFEPRRRLMGDWASYLAGGSRAPDRSVDPP